MKWLLLFCSVGANGLDSLASFQLPPAPRAAHRDTMRMGLHGTVFTMEGRSVASATVQLTRNKQPQCLSPNAEYLSFGPPGEAVPDTIKHVPGRVYFDENRHHRLRVTINHVENDASLTIDDILIGRADSRRVVAQYTFWPYGELQVRALWDALMNAPRVLGPDP